MGFEESLCGQDMLQSQARCQPTTPVTLCGSCRPSPAVAFLSTHRFNSVSNLEGDRDRPRCACAPLTSHLTSHLEGRWAQALCGLQIKM